MVICHGMYVEFWEQRSYINQTVINLNYKVNRIKKAHCEATTNPRLFILVI